MIKTFTYYPLRPFFLTFIAVFTTVYHLSPHTMGANFVRELLKSRFPYEHGSIAHTIKFQEQSRECEPKNENGSDENKVERVNAVPDDSELMPVTEKKMNNIQRPIIIEGELDSSNNLTHLVARGLPKPSQPKRCINKKPGRRSKIYTYKLKKHRLVRQAI